MLLTGSSPFPHPAQFAPSEEFLQTLLKCIQEVSQHLRAALAPPNNPHILMMRSLLETTMQLRIAQNYTAVLSLLQKVSSTSLTYFHYHKYPFSGTLRFCYETVLTPVLYLSFLPQALEGLLEGMNPPPSDPDLFVSFRDCHLLILKMIQAPCGLGSDQTMHHVTRILLNAREDIKYSPRAIILLIGLQIVDMKSLDEYLAKVLCDACGIATCEFVFVWKLTCLYSWNMSGILRNYCRTGVKFCGRDPSVKIKFAKFTIHVSNDSPNPRKFNSHNIHIIT